MYKPRFMLKWLCVGLLLIFCLGGCAIWDRFFSEEEKAPAELMSEGMEDFDKGSFEAASEEFQKLKDRYPYSKFAIEAELMMANAQYKRKLYDEAFEDYDEFERLHPKNRNIPYVIYRKGMCHFSQASTIDRDQSNIFKAKEEFERLVKKFPRTEYANRARAKIRKCYMDLAEHELYVGQFYYKMNKYRAAVERYRYVLMNYPDLGQYHEALEFLSKCKEKIAKEQKRPDQALPIPQKKAIGSTQKQEGFLETRPPKPIDKPLVKGVVSQGEKSTRPKVPEIGKSTSQKMGLFSVQVGAFLVKENAEELVSGLMRKGYKPFIFQTADSRKRQWYCVRIGNYADLKQASQAASKFYTKQNVPAIVTSIDSPKPVTLKNK